MEHIKSGTYADIDEPEEQRQIHVDAVANQAFRPKPELKWRSKSTTRPTETAVLHRFRLNQHEPHAEP